MKILCEKGDPNGFKLLLASKLSGQSVTFVEQKGVTTGALLEIETGDGTYEHLSSNSGVLYLLQSGNNKPLPNDLLIVNEKWLKWEATALQMCLSPYLSSLTSDYEDKTLYATVSTLLTSINVDVAPFNSKDLSATDVVVMSSLLPFTTHEAGKSLLQQFPALTQHIQQFSQHTIVKECISSWWGGEISLKPWALMGYTGSSALDIHNQIKNKGVELYSQKESKAAKDVNKVAVDQLRTLKNDFKYDTGLDWKPDIDVTKLVKRKAGKKAETAAQTEHVQQREEVSSEQIVSAKSSWSQPSKETMSKTKVVAPILPKTNDRNILITSALPYTGLEGFRQGW